MKNIFYVFLLMPLFYLGAQDEGPYLIRLHVVEVEGNIAYTQTENITNL